MKRSIKNIALSILLATSMNCSQPAKSIQTPNYNYSKEIFESKGTKTIYNIIKIPHNTQLTPKIIISDQPKQLEKLIPDALIGINGAFFTPEGEILGYVKSQDSLLSKTRLGSKVRGYLIHNNEGFSIDTVPNIEYNDLVLESYPLLEFQDSSRVKTQNSKHFRSAVAIDKEKNLYLITTNNTVLFSNKISYLEFKEFLETKNYYSVLNLDGGSSSQLFAKPAINQKGGRIYSALGFYE